MLAVPTRAGRGRVVLACAASALRGRILVRKDAASAAFTAVLVHGQRKFMSWHIHVYPVQVKTDYHNLPDQELRDAYLENAAGLPKFSDDQLAMIRKHLERRNYSEMATGAGRFTNEGEDAEALLTVNGLFFTGHGEAGTMEVSMTASEFASDYFMRGNFTVHDIQNRTWKPADSKPH
jgi:hypothetical protein